MPETEIGIIEHYFGKIEVAALRITSGQLCIGDTIHIQGHTTDLTTTIDSMQVEHDSVDKVKKGDAVGIKVSQPVRVHDKVFKVTE
jgi:putative protease